MAQHVNLIPTEPMSTQKGHFIIGDIHGCLHTFKTVLKQWDREKEILICVGDFVDRGNSSDKVIELCMGLEKDCSDSVVFLKGNHDLMLVEHVTEPPNELWLMHGGIGTLAQFGDDTDQLKMAADWLNKLPLYHETDQLFISHAGISETDQPFDQNNPLGIVWSKSPVKRIEKLQIHGHRALGADKPVYSEESNSWNIDTGACYGFGLTGLRVDDQGQVKEWHYEPTDPRDI